MIDDDDDDERFAELFVRVQLDHVHLARVRGGEDGHPVEPQPRGAVRGGVVGVMDGGEVALDERHLQVAVCVERHVVSNRRPLRVAQARRV